MVLRRLVRGLPPIARRDAQLREARQRNAELRDRLADARRAAATKTPPPSSRPGWEPPAREKAVELVRRSGLFDERWYLAHVGAAPGGDPVEHLVAQGDAAGLSPHPVFVPSWYLSRLPDNTPGAARRAPFLHYLTSGAAQGISPHPLFDAERYLEAHPRSSRKVGGPVAHFLSRGVPLTGSAGGTGAPWDDPAQLLAQARTTGEALLAAEDPSLVSVVVPTKDRTDVLVDLKRLRDEVDGRDPDLLSVVTVLIGDDNSETVQTGVERMLRTATGPVEVVVVDSRSAPEVFTSVHSGLSRFPEVQVRRLTQPLPVEVARNVGVQWTSGARLVFLASTLWTEPGWDGPLIEGLERHTVVQPLVLSPGGAVWSAGVECLSSGSWFLPWSGFSGTAPEVRAERKVAAVSAGALAVCAADFLDAGGFEPLVRDDDHGGEFSLRPTSRAGGSAACLPTSVVAWRAHPPEGRPQAGLMRVRGDHRREQPPWGEAGCPPRSMDEVFPGYRLVGFGREHGAQTAPRPLVVHDRLERPLRWAIKIDAPTVQRRTSSGDWHAAESLRDALERLGHEVSIDCGQEWYRPSSHLDDVVLQVRGTSSYAVNPGHTNVSWVISRPDRVSAAELSDYDLVYGASPGWCTTMSARLGRPVVPLLKCTDQHRFHAVPPDPRRTHEVLVVANARGVRPSVRAALEAGIVPEVYGVGWEGLLPEGAWRGSYLPNDELPSVYTGAGVVLADHWEDMQEQGMLSNRLFDLTACEARVVSDHLPEIEEVFRDVVQTFGPDRDIAEAIRAQLEETPDQVAARRELGAMVRREHTFDARAAQLSEAVLELRAREGAPRLTK